MIKEKKHTVNVLEVVQVKACPASDVDDLVTVLGLETFSHR